MDVINVYALFGIPSSGKGVQGQLLQARNPEFLHISTGDIFRAIKNKNEDLELIAKMESLDKNNGSLYPDELTRDKLDEEINNRIYNGSFNPTNQTLIFDGYPRNLKQIQMMEGKYEIIKLAYLDVPKELAVGRGIKRFQEKGRIEDADPAKIRIRIDNYKKSIDTMLEYYNIVMMFPEEQIKTINGAREIEEIYKDVEKFFKA